MKRTNISSSRRSSNSSSSSSIILIRKLTSQLSERQQRPQLYAPLAQAVTLPCGSLQFIS
ncbi:hypothetical protein C0J52_16632 [Blattella germanica]|nr:hypothetical protein C0J52_16632 [Blattella germanica]